MVDNEVLINVSDGVMEITINRPEARNAVNLSVAKGVANAIDILESDEGIKVAILTGAGGTFCSGMDLKAFIKGEHPVIEGRGFAGVCEKPPKKPLIAAVEGYALAGGFELAIACDLIVASESAMFGIPEVKRGLIAGAGGLLRLPRQVPIRMAKELAIMGELITSHRAFEIGLINRVSQAGGALSVAHAMAKVIAGNAPLAVKSSKELIDNSQDWSSQEMFELQAPIVDFIVSSEDALEGASAFAEKRAPHWTCK